MRTPFAVALLALATAGAAFAATASFADSDSHCRLFLVANGQNEQPLMQCSDQQAGTLTTTGCTAQACGVAASGSASAQWSLPGTGYVQLAVAYFRVDGPPVGETVCGAVAPTPGTSASCSGTSAPLQVPVAAGACREFHVVSGAVIDLIYAVNFPVLYFNVGAGNAFNLCRDGAGTPSLVPVG